MWEDLVCPVDHGELHGQGDWLACRKCGRGYPVLDGIPRFLSPDENPAWRAAQQRRVDRLPAGAGHAPEPHFRSVRQRGRMLEERLSHWVEWGPATRILQIGVSREAELHHFRQGVRYGVEPLAGVLAARGLLRWGQVRWVAGRGEELPFADGNFKVVLLGDVLSHVESAERVLDEACRCLAPGGVLWLGCRTIGRDWRTMLSRLLGWGEVAAAVRQCNQAAAALLRQCRHAGLQRVWAGAYDEDCGSDTTTGSAHPGAASSWIRRDFVFHRRGRSAQVGGSRPREQLIALDR
jgi:uncharacterized protein YbaR (Trm112 family)